MNTRLLLLLTLAAPHALLSQDESRLHSDLRREFDALEPCGKFKLGSAAACGQVLATGQPFHIAVGSIAPQNGTAFGLAFIEHTDLQSHWRLNYNLDAVASGNGSWRAGGYLKAFRQPGSAPIVLHPGTAARSTRALSTTSLPSSASTPRPHRSTASTSGASAPIPRPPPVPPSALPRTSPAPALPSRSPLSSA